MSKVLVVGAGSREHALCWKLLQSPLLSELFLWPGNAASKSLGTLLDLPHSANFDQLVQKIQESGIDFVVCGPEQPLAEGLADKLQENNIPVFGPVKKAAMLESSKSFAKAMMKEAGIQTASYTLARSREECEKLALACLENTQGVVLKASGLAGGKGVFVCFSKADIEVGLEALYNSKMKSSADEVVVEEVLHGRECSYFTFVGNGKSNGLGFAVDFKRLKDGDQGPNTGGMGCYTPVPWLPEDAGTQVDREVVEPLLETLKANDIDYCGWLYVGLMWGDQGPKIVEFNVRLGDPEAQILAVADERDWLQLVIESLPQGSMQGVASSEPQGKYQPKDKVVGVVVASADYPYGGGAGAGCALASNLFAQKNASYTTGEVLCFAAAVEDINGEIASKSGRVLTAVGRGPDYRSARANVYQTVDRITKSFTESTFRHDIAEKVSLEEK